MKEGLIKMIIGFTGFAGAGKDSTAQFILEKYPTYQKISLAKKLKDITAILYDWDRDDLEGITEQARLWREQEDKNLSKIFNRTIIPRHELQLLGTGLRNILQQDFWTKLVQKEIVNNNLSEVLITDVRFPDEIKMIRSLGGYIVEIQREKIPNWYYIAAKYNLGKLSLWDKIIHFKDYIEFKKAHISEKAWIGINNPDLLIINPKGDLNLLREGILDFMNLHNKEGEKK